MPAFAPLPRWEHFAHDADSGVRGIGRSREEAFEQGALALTSVITDVEAVAPRQGMTVACEAPNDDFLFVEWLNALVFEMATRKMLFSRFSVRIDGFRLTAKAWGEPVDVARHQPAAEVKGATLTALRVAREKDGTWIAQCVVDV